MTIESVSSNQILRFTPEQDQQLRSHFNVYRSTKWKLVADSINKTAAVCHKRFWRHIATDAEKTSQKKLKKLTAYEKTQLRAHFDTHGPKDWHLVASLININKRYCSTYFWRSVATDEEKSLQSKSKKFTLAEEIALMTHYNKYGAKKWIVVAKDLDRSARSCSKHFWKCLATPEEKLKKRLIQKFSDEDDAQLRLHVDTYGPSKWKVVAKSINKAANSCMTRFWSHLATPEEKKRRSTRQNPKQQTKSNEMQSATVQLLQLGSEKETVINSHNKRSASTTENSIQTASSTDTGKRARTTI